MMRYMWNIKQWGLLLVAFLAVVPVRAGSDDFGIWTDVGVVKSLPYGWSLSLEAGFRSADLSRSVDRWSGIFGVGYKPFKHLKLEASYSFLYSYEPSVRKEHYRQDVMIPTAWNGFNVTSHYWKPRNRVSVEATGDIKVAQIVKISLRERYQFTHQKKMEVPRTKYRYKKDFVTLKNGYPLQDVNEKESKRVQYLRSRLKVEIDKKGWKAKPFASFELYNDLDNELALNRTRFSLGSAYKVTRRHEVSAAYVFNNDVDEEPFEGRHVMSFGYTFKF